MNLPLTTEFRESVGMALQAVGAHKLRSALTLLGVLIGVFSIILVMTALRALQSNLEKQLAQLGSHTFQVQRFPAIQVDGDSETEQEYWRRRRFYLPVARQLSERLKLAQAVGVSADLDVGEASSRFAKTNPDIPLQGLSSEAFETRNLAVTEGRAFSESDVDSSRLFCVLGADLAKKLFPFGSPLGESVRYRGIGYNVVGVLEAKGSMFGRSMDSFMAIPISTALDRYGRERSIQIQIQARDQAHFDDTVEEARAVLRTLRKVPPGQKDDFEIVSNDSIISQFRSLTLVIRTVAGVIASIALLAAGIGIMNIMLVSVTERTREIGIRRAVGAKKRNIMTQFILEAIVLCEIGGIAGVLLGVAAGNLGAMALKTPPVIPWDWALIGLAVCSLVGVVFGTYPAWKAANLDPIESLRYE